MRTQVLSESPYIVLVHNLLSPAEADYLVNLTSARLQRSCVVEGDRCVPFVRC